MSMRRYSLIVFALFLAALPLLPVPEFWITQLNYIGLYALVVIGLVLLTGVAGLTSFGQAAFVGVGAYTTAYLSLHFGCRRGSTCSWAWRSPPWWRWCWAGSRCACRATTCRWPPSRGA
jgi:ABC-type branched-subunit amino acid transport system permease subunit